MVSRLSRRASVRGKYIADRNLESTGRRAVGGVVQWRRNQAGGRGMN